MIIWILNSESGVKLLYKSFLKTDADEDIVSGFLTAFHHFSMMEFHQSLESIEMGGLRWIYILEQDYNLLFVAADNKRVKTAMLMGRLNVIKNAFIKEYEQVWKKKGKSWEGNLNVFTPFLKTIEDYYNQWEQAETLTDVADFFDILGIFQQILIMLRNILEKKMYTKSKTLILNHIEESYDSLRNKEEFKDQPELTNVSFTQDAWFNFSDINLIKCDKELVIKYLKSILTEVVYDLKQTKGRNLCLKYFNEEGIYAYIVSNMKLLKDLNLDRFFLELFLLI
ncbi:MAG: hypothetical protein ACFE8J_09285 [Candidatus Heimdallarchaeota archaeon]